MVIADGVMWLKLTKVRRWGGDYPIRIESDRIVYYGPRGRADEKTTIVFGFGAFAGQDQMISVRESLDEIEAQLRG